MQGRCARKLRDTDPARYCIRYPLRGRTCCALHGGLSPVGAAHHNTRTGEYSQYLTGQTLSAYEQSLADERAKTLAGTVALCDARIKDLCGQLQTGERGTVWDDLVGVVADAKAGIAMAEVLPQLERIAAAGKATVQGWRELGEWQDRKARLVMAEARRQSDGAETLSRQQVSLFIGSIGRLIVDHVHDQAAKTAVVNGLEAVGRRMLGAPEKG